MNDLSRRHVLEVALLGAASMLAAAPLASAAEPVPLAIKGYDPVAYFILGRPTRGRPDLDYEWDEHRYLFANPEHREMFKADPVRYAPQFANYCAMALSMGELVIADPESWLISDSRLYIFGKRMGPEQFQQDLPGNIARANHNRPLILQR